MRRGAGARGLVGRAMGSTVHVGLQGQQGMHFVGLHGQRGTEDDHGVLSPSTTISDGSRQVSSKAAADDVFPQHSRSGLHRSTQ